MTVSDRYADALAWASRLHHDQLRKGTNIPYVSHVLSVSALVWEYGGDEEQAIAGLLHDAIEDCDVARDEIVRRYGDRVAAIVDACTDTDEIPKPPWTERKRAYIAHLASAPADALIVSLADKAHNASCIAADVAREGDAYFKRFSGGDGGTRWYYRRLADEFVNRAKELPATIAGRPGAEGLLARYQNVIASFGATHDAAETFEATFA